MAIGWITDLVAANAYFLTERLDSTHWDALTAVSGGRDEKTAVLKMAYNRIRFCKDFSIPASPSAAVLERLQIAQYETAYYLAQHLTGEDTRKGLHVQGVVGAGIVQEVYVRFASDTRSLLDIPLPPIVYQLLEDLKVVEVPFAAIDIDRRENESVDTDVVDLNDTEY
jgi:hypothetical protein